MNRLIALCYFVLSLYGCEPAAGTLVHRHAGDGADALHSRVVAHPGGARFECVGSASGQCHYSVFAGDCGTPRRPATADAIGSARLPIGRCAARAPRHLAVARGHSLRVPGLHDFRVCVSTRAGSPADDCDAAGRLAAR